MVQTFDEAGMDMWIYFEGDWTRFYDYLQELPSRRILALLEYADLKLPAIEAQTLSWLVDIAQDVVDVSLCLDSFDPDVIRKVIPLAKRQGIINSVSEERNKPSQIYPLAEQYGWSVIALTIDDNGIPKNSETRLSIARKLIEEAGQYGITEDRLFIDPLVIALSTDNQSMLNFIATMKQIKQEHPSVKITSGLSNISFGMPKRKLINRQFLTLALYEGMDSAIMDPLDKEMVGAILAMQALLGQDRNTRMFSNAYRRGDI